MAQARNRAETLSGNGPSGRWGTRSSCRRRHASCTNSTCTLLMAWIFFFKERIVSLGSPAVRTRAPTLSAGVAVTGGRLSPCTRNEHSRATATPAAKRSVGSLCLSLALSRSPLARALSLGRVARVRLTVQEDGLPLPFDTHIHGHFLPLFPCRAVPVWQLLRLEFHELIISPSVVKRQERGDEPRRDQGRGKDGAAR